MTGLWNVFGRELRNYLYSPLAYVILAVFLAIGGYIFSVIFLSTRVADLQGYFNNMGLILVFVVPVLTMRLWAEEEQRGTDEFLLTAPLTVGQILWGKYLAAVAIFLLGLGFSLAYPLFLAAFGRPDWGLIASGYLGFFLLGLAYLAVGLFSSALTNSQMVAALISFGMLLALWVIGWLAQALGGHVGTIAGYLSAVDHYQDFLKGVIDTSHLLYFASFIGYFLFLAGECLKSRHGG